MNTGTSGVHVRIQVDVESGLDDVSFSELWLQGYWAVGGLLNTLAGWWKGHALYVIASFAAEQIWAQAILLDTTLLGCKTMLVP